MAEYSTFIPQNIATKGARRIGIYNSKGNRVGFIPLGGLSLPDGEKRYSFGALSDVHYQYETGADDFRNALVYLNNNEDVEFTCVCGDLTKNGTDAELTEYKTAVETHSPDTPVFTITGNHDTYQGLHDSIETYTGWPLYYSFTHKNDVFIMVGIVGESEDELFRTEILQWLYETLEENRNKRCFLFQHIPTYEGSGDCLNVYGGTKLKNETTSVVFKSLLSHYPNVIHFHGHTHMRYRLQEYGDNANYDNYFGCHSVHIPALAVQRDANADGDGFVSYIQGSEGYVVDVYENGIHLRGRDFVDGVFLPIASYWLDTAPKEVDSLTYTDATETIATLLIPKEYQQVEWICASGKQWINTGVSPQSENVIYECEWLETALEASAVVFGSTNTSYVTNKNRWSASHYHPVRGTLYSATGVTDQLCKLTGIIIANEKNTLKTTIVGGTITLELNGQSAAATYAGTIQNGINIGLFANNRNTTPFEYAKYTRMYRWKMTDGGVVVRNMIPCYRKSDGEIGMYDTVSKQFFTNAGTGEFSKGLDVLPSAYQRVEWIGASGKQWINTGVTPQSDNVVYECEWVETSLEKSACLFAATLVNYDTEKGNRFTGNLYHPGTGNLSFSIAKSSDICKYSGIVAGEKNTITVTILNGTVTRVVNGDSVTSNYNGTIQNGVNIGLFATNRDTTVHEYCKYTRIYGWKMTDNGAVVRNMLPCYRKSDGEIGMYDTVSGQFFVNAGTGEFSKGENVSV